MKYYSYKLDDFKLKKPEWEFLPFESLNAQNKYFAIDLIERIETNNLENRKTVIVLPVGPINYFEFIKMVNCKKINLKKLIIFFMDEYCKENGEYIDKEHPLSFRRFIEDTFVKQIDPKLRMPLSQIIFPNGINPEETVSLIDSYGGIDITYGGFGINGHLAFNDPPEEIDKCIEDNVRYSTVRVVKLSRETITQNAISGD